MNGVSPATIRDAYQTTTALEAAGIPIEGIAFDEDADAYRIILGDGGEITPSGLRGGTGKGGS